MEEKRLKAQIVEAADSIRKKYNRLKRGADEEEELINKQFEGIVNPLKTLVDLTADQQKIKTEPKEESAKQPQKKRVKKRKKEASDDDDEDVSDEEFYETIEEDPKDERAKEQWKGYLAGFGPLTRKYLDAFMWDTSNHFDTKFGVRMDTRKNQWKIGSEVVNFDIEDYIHIGENMIKGTEGLFELIFKKFPNSKLYTEADKHAYKRVLELTNGHYQKYDPGLRIASSSNWKYNNIISDLFRMTGGRILPVTGNDIDYIHWNDVNELVSRLALLHASLLAGNKGVLPEIASIEEELREGNYIE